jgi:hypothetical protein
MGEAFPCHVYERHYPRMAKAEELVRPAYNGDIGKGKGKGKGNDGKGIGKGEQRQGQRQGHDLRHTRHGTICVTPDIESDTQPATQLALSDDDQPAAQLPRPNDDDDDQPATQLVMDGLKRSRARALARSRARARARERARTGARERDSARAREQMCRACYVRRTWQNASYCCKLCRDNGGACHGRYCTIYMPPGVNTKMSRATDVLGWRLAAPA